MKKTLFACLLAAAAALSSFRGSCDEAAAAPRDYYGRIAKRLAAMLPRYHVLQHELDDEISARAWTNIVTYYDFDHSVFLQSDLDALASRQTTLDDELRAGDVSFGFEIYDLYCKRLGERIDFATNLLARAEWDFSVDETYRIKRKDAPWPATKEEAEEHWRKRVKNETLAQILSREIAAEKKAAKEAEKAAEKDAGESSAADGADSAPQTESDAMQGCDGDGDEDEEEEEEDGYEDDDYGSFADKSLTPEQNLIKKYRQYYITLTEPDEEQTLQNYLSAVCHAYDPHTDYLSPMTKEDFDMDMNLTLCGVGAVLSMDDGALKISEIMPGGPIDMDGRIKEGDKITGVKQEEGELEDIMWKPMRKTIHKIRGKKGTRVTLEIQPRGDPDGATRKYIELVRDEIKLDEQAATGRVERVSFDGAERKLGYVMLPSFYGTMDKQPGQEGYLSCADDVAKYVADFNESGVEGMVLDLRSDGGGSLKEAVMLSSLFVPSGPVVLIRDARRTQPLAIPRGNPAAFRKPLVVLIDRASASASEIVAAHLRDCGRAVVLGDARSHGKGTVQTVIRLGPEKYGSAKITTQRFYRINGRSTQVEGVASDICLPSFLNSLDIGEDSLPNALPFTRIPAPEFTKAWNLDAFIPELAALSGRRTSANEAFVRHCENVKAARAVFDREEVSLERGKRKATMLSDREITERERASSGGEAGEARPRRRGKRNRAKENDVVLDEAFRVLSDLVRINAGEELPPAPFEWYDAILGF